MFRLGRLCKCKDFLKSVLNEFNLAHSSFHRSTSTPFPRPVRNRCKLFQSLAFADNFRANFRRPRLLQMQKSVYHKHAFMVRTRRVRIFPTLGTTGFGRALFTAPRQCQPTKHRPVEMSCFRIGLFTLRVPSAAHFFVELRVLKVS